MSNWVWVGVFVKSLLLNEIVIKGEKLYITADILCRA